MTGAAFNDAALLSGSDSLDQYRVLHFATHGLVTAPRPDCPARPALVTSFAPDGSDGLLSFREIFDLKLDADVVILSACDTAGSATAAVSREAGIATGGNYALDGLVRAFVGAGARSVVASHWPVPDDYDATKRLIGGLVNARPGQPLAGALEEAQEKLMDDPEDVASLLLGGVHHPRRRRQAAGADQRRLQRRQALENCQVMVVEGLGILPGDRRPCARSIPRSALRNRPRRGPSSSKVAGREDVHLEDLVADDVDADQEHAVGDQLGPDQFGDASSVSPISTASAVPPA